MDKQTLSNYGWIVIAVLVLAVMIAMATPFGQFIENGVRSTTQGLFDVEQNALGAAGMVIGDNSFTDSSGGTSGEQGGTGGNAGGGYVYTEYDSFFTGGTN